MGQLTPTAILKLASEYVQELTQLQSKIEQHPFSTSHKDLLLAKINIKITHLRTIHTQLLQHQPSKAALKQLHSHMSHSFSAITKEAHRMLQLALQPADPDKLQRRLAFLGQMEQELDEQWQGQQEAPKESLLLSRLDQNTSTIAEHIDKRKLKSIAKQYLNKEFLAIRMVAYRMYQSYVTHAHPDITSQLQELQNVNQQLSQQVVELSDFNRTLKAEEKRLARQLQQLKQTNELISRRYFRSASNSEQNEH